MPAPPETLPLAEDLLDLYLSLPKKDRERRFIDTTHATEITGLSSRTIQFWIERGLIRAVAIGKKYQIDVTSLRAYLRNRADVHN